MRRKLFTCLIVGIACTVVLGREGWYFDFSLGPNAHIDFDDRVDNFPRGVRADAHSSLLTELDIGYSFPTSFTFGFGFELNNIVDVGYKLDLKWSFLQGRDFQPYVYTCVHGGITDLPLLALHAGYGVDMFITERAYMFLDGRVGPALISDDPPRDAAGEARYAYHLESALSFGVGVLFGSKAGK